MKRALSFTLGSATVLVLLTALGGQFISGAPPGREQSVAPQGTGRTLVITSTADSGHGTLRQALLDAQRDDTITFDPAVFPPTSPVTISLTTGLPEISQGNLTIDASNAGVILDGSNIGTTPATLLLDDVSLTLDGGPNLITNGDFSAGLGHWRPWDEAPGATRRLNSSEFHSSPYSYEWSSVAHAGESITLYDTTDTSEPFGYRDQSWPFYDGSTLWVPATGGSTAELHFWYKHGPVAARLHVLFPDGHEEQITDWWFNWQTDWTEAVASQAMPADAVGIALELSFRHPESARGLSIISDGNMVQGLQIIKFPYAGVSLRHGAQNNIVGGDRRIGVGPLGQGNLISSNVSYGVGLFDAGTSFNTIIGNFIGTNLSGTVAWGHRLDGVFMNGASRNQVIDNLISGNGGHDIYLCCTSDTSNNTISDNYIGTDASGLNALGNHGDGISTDGGANYNVIERNIISSNVLNGVSISGSDTMSNTVSSNYIGTDVSGLNAFGNHENGIRIDDSASYNVIGPDNVIAYNGGHGVGVYGPDSLRNTITQNSIHDNDGKGIDLWDGGNAQLAAPLIFDFDLAAGTVTGTACHNCTVEIFSDTGDQGRIYEGQTTAQPVGSFTLNKSASFTGPHLTATATDTDGNTSVFSPPTSGTVRSLILQEGNNLPRIQLQPRESQELEDNRIGPMLEGPYITTLEEADWAVLNINGMGAKWVRFSIDHFDSEVVTSTGKYSRHYVDPIQDRVITGLANNDIMVMYSLVFWDDEIEVEEGYSRFKTEEEIQRYLDYAQFIVHHFKDRIDYFEILNEPESPYPAQHVEIPDYINLVRRTVPIIRQEYPNAKIVVGATTDLEYLLDTLQSDVIPLVDAVSWHVAGGESPGCKDEYWNNYASLVQEIKDAASSHGFAGEYVAEELIWRTPENVNPLEPWHWTYSEPVAAKCYVRGIILDLGMNLTTGLTPLDLDGLHSPNRFIGRVIQNLCTIMAGAEPASFLIDIQSEATNIMSYTFSLSDGDRLIALWTDGVAVDDDPGIEATLTLPGFSDHMVVGIDVLNGFEQQMITSEEEGNLVIRDLLIKDYPIIFRLTSMPTPTPTPTPSTTPTSTPTLTPTPIATTTPTPTSTPTATATATTTPTPTNTPTATPYRLYLPLILKKRN